MNNEDFTQAARAEAERRWPRVARRNKTAEEWLDEGMASGFVLGAQWSAAQEPTNAEVEAAARQAVPALLDMLDQAEADRDWNIRSSRLAKEERIRANARAERAEARIKAVEDVLDRPADGTEDMDSISAHYANGYEIALQDIRRALDGDQ